MRKITDMKSKKGDIFQIFFVMVIVFVIAIIGLIFLVITRGVSDAYTNSGILNSTVMGQSANERIKESGTYATDYMVFFFFLGSNIGLIISAVKTNFSPTIVFLFILLFIISIFLASGLTNIYRGLADSDTISATSQTQYLTNVLFSKYTPLFFCVIGGLILIIMYSKSGSEIIS